VADGRDLRPLLDVARPWLAGAVAVGIGQAMLLLAQAALVASLLSSAFAGGLTVRAAARDSLLILLLAVGQGLIGWAFENCAEGAARRARSAARRRALAHAIRLAASAPGTSADRNGERGIGGTDGEPAPGGAAALLGPGIDELDAFVGRAVPRAVLAVALPALLLTWIARLNLLSAALAGLALTVGALVAALIGTDTASVLDPKFAQDILRVS
jgi:ABC-type transport system involved in cytochrome bd biosynthesis fused ATPase/permease subunit